MRLFTGRSSSSRSDVGFCVTSSGEMGIFSGGDGDFRFAGFFLWDGNQSNSSSSDERSRVIDGAEGSTGGVIIGASTGGVGFCGAAVTGTDGAGVVSISSSSPEDTTEKDAEGTGTGGLVAAFFALGFEIEGTLASWAVLVLVERWGGFIST